MLIGIDIMEVKRIGIIEQKDSILHRLFTQSELDIIKELGYKRRIINLACIFAAKEAAVKALGTGFTEDIRTQDIQVILTGHGKGRIEFLAEAKKLAVKLGIKKTHLALGSEKELVIAMVVLENQ